MMGDAAAAAEYVEKLRAYTAETPFEFGDISDAVFPPFPGFLAWGSSSISNMRGR